MPEPIEDYALLSNCRTAALVSRSGSIDWLCLPRYDSGSVFAALLGDASHGRWSLRPADPSATPHRRYDGETFLLVTRWECADGVVEVHDVMPLGEDRQAVVRRVVGVEGDVEMASEVGLRFDYARSLPWVRQIGSDEAPALLALAGPDAVVIRGPRMSPHGKVHRAVFPVRPGDVVDSTLAWNESFRDDPPAVFDVDAAIEHTRAWWTDWAARVDHTGAYRQLVIRSLLVLRALTHADTGGIVAAATTSLPERIGGTRNWDYRYVWLRDAALTLEAYVDHGYLRAARRWRQWLLRAVAGDPADVQIMYGIAGERDLAERELDSLPGYADSRPVRVGNGAVSQYQADVLGEVLVALEDARLAGVDESEFSWELQRALLNRIIEVIDLPDHGIWEIRGEPRMFTHSRVMVWAALDRGVRAVEEQGMDGGGDADAWRDHRGRMRAEIDARGVDPEGGYFVQHYATREVDASLLLLPAVGYCAADDPRMRATVACMEETLMRDGFLLRYRTESGVDGLAGDEHPFLACSFWLVQQYAASGRREDAEELMARLCAIPNDLGLMAEEYDPQTGHHRGNTPQALSHLALVGAADALGGHAGRAASRS